MFLGPAVSSCKILGVLNCDVFIPYCGGDEVSGRCCRTGPY